jgi:NAD(P)-dependent dehydrogenase (short-subunit alcohol dehydrogenase family)
VTGGCSGIGKEVVLRLIEKGVRVAVLDVQPLPHDLERSAYSGALACVDADWEQSPRLPMFDATLRPHRP